jgi:hypothetical protein
MRSWISATSSLESVVTTAKVRIHPPEAGSLRASADLTRAGLETVAQAQFLIVPES